MLGVHTIRRQHTSSVLCSVVYRYDEISDDASSKTILDLWKSQEILQLWLSVWNTEMQHLFCFNLHISWVTHNINIIKKRNQISWHIDRVYDCNMIFYVPFLTAGKPRGKWWFTNRKFDMSDHWHNYWPPSTHLLKSVADIMTHFCNTFALTK